MKEIENLKKEIERLEMEQQQRKEKRKLEAKLKKLKFQEKHSGLLNITGKLEQGTKRVFGSIGSGLKKAGKTLEKSDEWIAEQKRKESEQQKKIKKQKPKKEEWNWLD